MFTNNNVAQALSNIGAFKPQPTKAMLDAAEAEKEAAKAEMAQATLDAAGEHAVNEIRQEAANSVNTWAATTADDLDEGETMADRLVALAVGIADSDKDGELTPDESDVINVALNAMADYMVDKGASEEDVVALLENSDTDAGDRISELLSEGDDSDVDSFAFDAESSDAVMDSVVAMFDAVYKKKMVIRGGKKVRINKRVSGHVRLSAGQKVAIRKASMKARSSTARMHRMKSMKIRNRTIG